MYTIVVGNPWDGMELRGLFESFDEAERIAFEEFSVTEWWIKEIDPV